MSITSWVHACLARGSSAGKHFAFAVERGKALPNLEAGEAPMTNYTTHFLPGPLIYYWVRGEEFLSYVVYPREKRP
jgi:hypothetical protein